MWTDEPGAPGSEAHSTIEYALSGSLCTNDILFPPMEGFKGMIALGDRHSGRTLGITFWESEEAMRTFEESAEAGGDTIASVERYDVGFFEVES